MIGAISFFHSVPADDLPALTRRLKLDRCVLAGIFQRKITTWDDAQIQALNPGITIPAGTAINVVVRNLGSSSTSLSSQYLSMAGCSGDNKWTIGAGGGGKDGNGNDKNPKWPAGVVRKEGSGGVSGHIAATPYSIGYIDSGHGHASGLAEISLENKNGTSLTSKEADIGAAGTAAVTTAIAADMSLSWDAVSLMDLPGATTWPICTFSYIYIRMNMTSTALLTTGPLVKAFAEFVLSDEGQGMVPEFGFTGIPLALKTSARAAVANNVSLATGAVKWTFETGTDAGAGMSATTFSAKRSSYADVERKDISDNVVTMKAQVADLMKNEVVQLHGSGTTNPKRFFWKTMDILEERAMVPMTMTYRAVGSSTGQHEFKGDAPARIPFNHFGSGDIPMSQGDYDMLHAIPEDKGAFVHIPFQLGAISFFHSAPTSVGEINLDACTLAKIFQRTITTWDHAEIKALNPNGLVGVPAGQAITVVRRTYGSSSTKLSSQYLDLVGT
jgi:ABC-type phosphate transport system substrate-binding protein